MCYAEKQHGDVLKHISAVKSPMAVMGAAVKTRVASTLGLAPKGVFHAAVMPCFDKKLEAAREDLAIAGEGIPDVDCVLTTGEVAEMLARHRESAGGVEADAGTDASDFDARRGAALLALEGFPVASFDSPFTDDAFGANAPTTNVNAAVNDGEDDPVAVGGATWRWRSPTRTRPRRRPIFPRLRVVSCPALRGAPAARSPTAAAGAGATWTRRSATPRRRSSGWTCGARSSTAYHARGTEICEKSRWRAPTRAPTGAPRSSYGSRRRTGSRTSRTSFESAEEETEAG